MAGLFARESHWRNLAGVSWSVATFSGGATVAGELFRRAAECSASDFRIDAGLLAPRETSLAGHRVLEAVFRLDGERPRQRPSCGCFRV